MFNNIFVHYFNEGNIIMTVYGKITCGLISAQYHNDTDWRNHNEPTPCPCLFGVIQMRACGSVCVRPHTYDVNNVASTLRRESLIDGLVPEQRVQRPLAGVGHLVREREE